MSELTDKLEMLNDELQDVERRLFLASGLQIQKDRLVKEIVLIEKQIKEMPVKSYHLVASELLIHYSNEVINLIMSYGPFEYVKDEYFNNGFGDSGYNVYLKVTDGMIGEKSLFGFFDAHLHDGMIKVSEYLLKDYKYRQTYE